MFASEKFKDSLAFYSAYHRHPTNQLIHCITIPIIVYTVLQWLAYITIYSFANLPLLRIHAGLPLIVVYTIIYFLCDDTSALIITGPLIGIYILTNYLWIAVPKIWMYALILHVVSWILQFAGHGVWEKRKPALFDSLIQAFVMAPLFVVVELQFRLGYRYRLMTEIATLSNKYDPIIKS